MSWLAGLVLNLLPTQRRLLEAATLKGFLRNPTTSAKAEYFLRYTMARDLMAQLQSPNPASVLRDVHPLLVESSTLFLSHLSLMMKSLPRSQHVGTGPYSLPLYLHVIHERSMLASSVHVSCLAYALVFIYIMCNCILCS